MAVVPDVEKLGGPQWFAVALTACVFGAAAVFTLYETLRVPGLQDEKRAAEQKLADVKQELEKSNASLKQWSDLAAELSEQVKTSESPTRVADLKSSREQCLRNNEQWQTAYAKVAANAEIHQQVERLEARYRELAGDVTGFAVGICKQSKDPSNCDLIPADQRTLQAMQAQRDQTHARLMQLQDKVACSKP